ncbi:group 10 secretory phospholipase A2 isoform X1 [Dromaius novaehollandiae]|uniref:Phospholipase A2 n=1 Tax=Dromaius novaehollandiae TaxID=8790 RepID=A0A8C4KJ74_DRONO|nr:group 10 secretory phospholipase A2 isoform X1 [Dromaius novaehollandiae]XP_025952207.1 group 10 secretory phospholipase A2 isoform X1 [Dromaius novaehollandiae]XP_025952209.1 group 10 secretory phospholipase A2 isoform X1 [Dromaius novaehollandiae]XP_025952210.1 group 10 secretory phospholipase A2 isoform X1 [Dromaius novaehollandiae]
MEITSIHCSWPRKVKISRYVYKGTVGEAHFRNRRGILELAGAIRCTTGRSPFAYLRYGCYCGLGGKGWPKDKLDWCCFNHDCCYSKAEQAGCNPKIESYSWECEDNVAVCEPLEDRCQKMACECDSEAAKCFSKAPYNAKYFLWPDFMCGEIQPFCRY